MPRRLRFQRNQLSIASRLDPGSFDHENHGSLRGPCPMHYTFRDCKSLPRCKLDRPVFQINDETPLHHIEELVFLIVLVPVELSLHDAEPDDAIIHLAKCLVIPRILARIDECLNVNELKGSVSHV